jgi:hypothetical protein
MWTFLLYIPYSFEYIVLLQNNSSDNERPDGYLDTFMILNLTCAHLEVDFLSCFSIQVYKHYQNENEINFWQFKLCTFHL